MIYLFSTNINGTTRSKYQHFVTRNQRRLAGLAAAKTKSPNTATSSSSSSIVVVLLLVMMSFPRLTTALATAATTSSKNIQQTVLVTGSTDGIGVTTAKNLASQGYNVLIHGRNEDRIKKAVQTISKYCDNHSNNPGRIIPLQAADISTTKGCIQLVESVKKVLQDNQDTMALTILMNNAGVYEESLQFTEDKHLEMTFAVNVLAPFVITSMLLSTMLRQTSPNQSRIVVASSISQCRSIRDWEDLPYYNTRPYSAHGSYSESKLLDAMLTVEMASRLQQAGIGTDKITCNCLDPGTVNTKMLCKYCAL
jgi:NAD(P)-dependent dehydrogenase (short-subunit alcohol dehydrogenase family)